MRETGRIVNVREAGSPSDCLSPGRAAAIPWQGRIRSSVLAAPDAEHALIASFGMEPV